MERCVGGFTQNNNESLNNLIWKIVLKLLNSGAFIVQLSAYIATCVFNEGTSVLLQIMQAMAINTGPYAHQYAALEDKTRIRIAELRAQEATRDARIEHLEAALSAEGLLYGPGVDDSM